MKYFWIICIAWCYSIVAVASNTLSLSSVSGTPQTEVELVVSLDNTDAISALEIVLPLGEHLSYVDGSASISTTRSNGHQISAEQVEQELRIYVYSLSLNTLQGSSGELLTFRLKLGNEPIVYTLNPSVVLTNTEGVSMDVSVQVGSATILAPKLVVLNPQIDYGHIPIHEVYTQELQLQNVGSQTLMIENIYVNNPLFIPQQTSLTIAAGGTSSVTIQYAPVNRGAVSCEATISSNAINGEQTAAIIADPFSVNELYVGSASGIADSTVTIVLTMNNMEPIVAMQCAFQLPDQLKYVENSLKVNAERSNGHQVLSTIQDDKLLLMIYSMTNQPFNGNDGEIATFQVRLNGNTGSYSLSPVDVGLSNAAEENMVSATYGGWVDIQSPSMYGEDYLSFGDVSITDEPVVKYTFSNHGHAPLKIERVSFLAEGYSILDQLPIMVNPWEEGSLQIAYNPSSEGDFSTTMNIYTNDPTNRLKTVALSGSVYEPNSLVLQGENSEDGTYTLSVSLDNYTDIVAVQYDLHWRSDMTTEQSAFIPSDRMQGHNYVVTPLGNGSYRVIVYSMNNAPFVGKEGLLHQLQFTPQGEINYCGDIITIDNIVLSNTNGTDKTSLFTATLLAEQTQWVTDTVIACDQYIWNNHVYNQSSIYIDTIISKAGCDSIVTLHLIINKSVATEETVAACDRYVWNGETYTESGEYSYTTTAANGCDSIVTLHLTINKTVTAEETVTACDSYEWNGETYTTSGEYTYTTTAVNGCDSVVTLYLTVNKSSAPADAYATICYGESYEWHGGVYASTGDYTIGLSNVHGCDSVVTLHLTVLPAAIRDTMEVVVGSDAVPYIWRGKSYSATGQYVNIEQYVDYACDSAIHVLDLTVLTTGTLDEQSVIICETELPYLWYDQTLTASGKYSYTEQYVGTDIDSVQHILNLTVVPTRYAMVEASICEGESYEWNGETYTTSGEYTYTTTAINGCDSVVTLHLTINKTVTAEETVIACDSYEWNGETYTTSGEYTYTTTAVNGCDSVVTLHLTINKTVTAEETVIACDSYEWNGETYTTSGEYTYTTTAANGCDSIMTLHLTILPDAIIESEELALCPSELPYEWYGQTLTQTGTYSSAEPYVGMECDSVIHELTLNVYVQTLPESVSLPIVRMGEPIDVSIPTAEIQAHINAATWYAPNTLIVWYLQKDMDWIILSNDPVESGVQVVVIKYAIDTDCGIVEAEPITIPVEITAVENTQEEMVETYKIILDDKVMIVRNGKIYTMMGIEIR